MPAPLIYPLINGYRPDYSSVSIYIAGLAGNAKKYVGTKSIGYKDSKKPGLVRGSASQVLGRTRGQYDAEGSIEFFEAEWADFLTFLGGGYLDTVFNVAVVKAEPQNGLLVTDALIGLLITEVDPSYQAGSDPLSVKVAFHAMRISRNGKDPLNTILV